MKRNEPKFDRQISWQKVKQAKVYSCLSMLKRENAWYLWVINNGDLNFCVPEHHRGSTQLQKPFLDNGRDGGAWNGKVENRKVEFLIVSEVCKAIHILMYSAYKKENPLWFWILNPMVWTCEHTHTYTHKHTHTHTHTHAHTHTDTQTDKHTHTHRQSASQPASQTDRHTHTHTRKGNEIEF